MRFSHATLKLDDRGKMSGRANRETARPPPASGLWIVIIAKSLERRFMELEALLEQFEVLANRTGSMMLWSILWCTDESPAIHVTLHDEEETFRLIEKIRPSILYPQLKMTSVERQRKISEEIDISVAEWSPPTLLRRSTANFLLLAPVGPLSHLGGQVAACRQAAYLRRPNQSRTPHEEGTGQITRAAPNRRRRTATHLPNCANFAAGSRHKRRPRFRRMQSGPSQLNAPDQRLRRSRSALRSPHRVGPS